MPSYSSDCYSRPKPLGGRWFGLPLKSKQQTDLKTSGDSGEKKEKRERERMAVGLTAATSLGVLLLLIRIGKQVVPRCAVIVPMLPQE